MLLDKLQVHVRVNQERNKEHVAQQGFAICSQTYGSSPGHQEVKRKNRRDVKSRENNTEPQLWMRKPGEGASRESGFSAGVSQEVMHT